MDAHWRAPDATSTRRNGAGTSLPQKNASPIIHTSPIIHIIPAQTHRAPQWHKDIVHWGHP